MSIPRHDRTRLAIVALLLVLVAIVGLGAAAPRARKPAPPPPTVADPDPSDTIIASPARWLNFPLLPDGRFPIAGYWAPPALQTTDFRYAEFAHAGLNVTLQMLEDPGGPQTTLQRIRVGARHDVWSFVLDNRISPGRAYATQWRTMVDSVVATYSAEQSVLGYVLADEPNPRDYASVAALNRRFSLKDPLRPGFVDFMGFPGPGIYYSGMPYTSYLRRYLDIARPTFFAVDSYPLLQGSDFPYYVTCWDSVGYVSRATGVPFWAILLLTPYQKFRLPTSSEMAWQADLALAYGAKGIVWFTYWTPNPTDPGRFHDGPVTYDGHHTASFGRLVDLNNRLQILGQEIGHMQWLGARQVGTLPYGCRPLRPGPLLRVQSATPVTIGFFQQMTGAPYALFVNRDYRKVATVSVFAPDTLLRWSRAPGLYRPLDAAPDSSGSIRNRILISPGDAELIRLPRNFDFSKSQ